MGVQQSKNTASLIDDVVQNAYDVITLPVKRRQRHHLEHASEFTDSEGGRRSLDIVRQAHIDKHAQDMTIHPAENFGTMPRIYTGVGGSLSNRPPLVHERASMFVSGLVETQINHNIRQKGDVMLVPHPVWGRGYAVQGRDMNAPARRCRPMQKLSAFE